MGVAMEVGVWLGWLWGWGGCGGSGAVAGVVGYNMLWSEHE